MKEYGGLEITPTSSSCDQFKAVTGKVVNSPGSSPSSSAVANQDKPSGIAVDDLGRL